MTKANRVGRRDFLRVAGLTMAGAAGINTHSGSIAAQRISSAGKRSDCSTN